ncbi:hypothetical protein J6590_081568 [Homalodisca vitripennis]|nr:hypothetical protein J6590_081568 [Homalodisca vitripennis]
MPETKKEIWMDIDQQFAKWNFPNAVGALDGKHVVIEAPPNTGADFYTAPYTTILISNRSVEYCTNVIILGSSSINLHNKLSARCDLLQVSGKVELPCRPNRNTCADCNGTDPEDDSSVRHAGMLYPNFLTAGGRCRSSCPDRGRLVRSHIDK